jgi:hypothetical protein
MMVINSSFLGLLYDTVNEPLHARAHLSLFRTGSLLRFGGHIGNLTANSRKQSTRFLLPLPK